MYFTHLLENLIYGELSSFHFAQSGSTADIKDKDLNKIISFTNDALSDIYSKIPTNIKTLVIDSLDNVNEYHLVKTRAMNYQYKEEPAYIRDSKEHPFTDEVLKVLEVHDECGRRIPLNDESHPGAVFTPYHNKLIITHPAKGKSYEVMYIAKPDYIMNLQDRFKMGLQVVNVPIQLEEALQIKIASRFFSGMTGQEVSNKYMDLINRYEAILADYFTKNMVDTTRLSETTRFKDRGYV